MTSAAVQERTVGAVEGDPNPFPGPKPYRTEQSRLFFGRERQIEELVSLVLSSRLVLVHAPSGYGKSSLLEAGLLPRLCSHDVVVLPTVRLGQVQSLPGGDDGNPFLRLLDEALRSSRDVPSRRPAAGPTPATCLRIVVIDQFEEIFLDPALWRERTDFLEHLRRAVEEDELLRVVLAVRSDFLADLLPHAAQLPNRLLVRFGLESLDEREARRVIREAFRQTQVPLSDDHVDMVLDALLTLQPSGAQGRPVRGQHVNLIQLQILCRRLWDELAAAGTAQPSSELLDLRASMRLFVDAAVTSVARETSFGEGVIRRWVEDNLITSGARRAVLPVEESGAGGLPSEVVLAMERARLVQVEQRNRTRWVELTHDSMVSAVQESNGRWAARWRRGKRRRTALAGLLVLVLLTPLPLHGPSRSGGSGLDRRVPAATGSGNGEFALPSEVDGPFAVSAVWETQDDSARARVTLYAEQEGGDRRPLDEAAVRVSTLDEELLLVGEPTPSAVERYVVAVETPQAVDYELFIWRLGRHVVLSDSSSPRRLRLPPHGRPIAVETESDQLLHVSSDVAVYDLNLFDSAEDGLSVFGGPTPWRSPAGAALVVRPRARHALLINNGESAAEVEIEPLAAVGPVGPGRPADVSVDRLAVVELDPPSAPFLTSTSCSARAEFSVADSWGQSIESHAYGTEPPYGASALVSVGERPFLVFLDHPGSLPGAARCSVRVDAVPFATEGSARP